MAFRPWKPKVEISFPKPRIRPTKEAAKQNDEVPFLGISDHEVRDSMGHLVNHLNNGNGRRWWIIVGKYAEPRADGNQFYVTHRSRAYLAGGDTTYHEDLLMAVAHVTKLKEEFEKC